ncbi:uncharacterized protein LOC144144599 [Haemaphysalis longicornis]
MKVRQIVLFTILVCAQETYAYWKKLWPKALIIYDVAKSVKDQEDLNINIRTALREIESDTCVRFMKYRSGRSHILYFKEPHVEYDKIPENYEIGPVIPVTKDFKTDDVHSNIARALGMGKCLKDMQKTVCPN